VSVDAGDGGASGVEYGLVLAAIAGVVVVVVYILGQVVHGDYKSTCDKLTAQEPSVTCEP
jgi:pilus assembly protein Flp/PilA